MKKIMFNDDFGLTAAVLNGIKTQTRRICSKKLWSWSERFELNTNKMTPKYFKVPYKIGEIVAIALPYKCFYDEYKEPLRSELIESAGFTNKMFVRPDLMPHQIEITDIKVEHIQDITDTCCLAEGIQKVNVRLEYDEPIDTIRYSFYGTQQLYDSPKLAYAALIDSICGKGTWENNTNVFAFTFKLIK